MSGFGGGGFGSNPPQQQQQGFGGGFGPAPPPVFGGFGSSPPPPQQQQQQQQQQQGFGSSGGFGQAPPAAAAVPFGSAPAAFAAPASSSFGGGGAAPPPSGFGAPAFGAPAAFGSPSGGGFGGGGFGQPPQQQQGFGGGNSTATTGFGSSSHGNDPFGGGPQQQHQQQPSIHVPNPFGAPASGAPAPAMSFGMSSNVVTTTTSNSMNRGLNANANSFQPSSSSNDGGMSFGAPASFTANTNNNNNPFGGGGGQDSHGGGMTFGSSNHHQSGTTMGGSSSPIPAFGQSFHDPFGGGGGNQHVPLQSIPEDTMGDGSGAGPFGGGGGGDGNLTWQKPSSGGGGGSAALSSSTEQEDKLAKLKAKLEAKKKKLLDKQKKQQQDVIDSSTNAQQQDLQPPPPALARQQRATKPQYPKDNNNKERGGGHRRNHSTSPLPVNSTTSSMSGSGMSSDNQSRAERNLQRFATNNTNSSTQAHLPSELRGMTEKPKQQRPQAAASSSSGGEPTTTTRKAVTSAVGGESNRETLANAKSLVGTCEYFCPDEELLRRERENDIQLLEIPDPGGIHPPDWTLRNTVVKRFRRSAADYKLDVPEWVRPPDVLEAACAYLEEWVMERDRQGPDRRFPQNGTPVSMDAYQFIWDRTRMIRKDFILQNFVGTGGKCDARAVRCHERIARWHAMCEHQLSHIADFAVMQSQQNIQELGQAMKTLNQYYDDSMGRALVEVPDDEGRETRRNPGDFSHGCQSDIVQGPNPVDYDGSPLNNVAESAAGRLIGKNMVNSPTRGTAEPVSIYGSKKVGVTVIIFNF